MYVLLIASNNVLFLLKLLNKVYCSFQQCYNHDGFQTFEHEKQKHFLQLAIREYFIHSRICQYIALIFLDYFLILATKTEDSTCLYRRVF